MAVNDRVSARAALFDAMALLGYTYRPGEPKVRSTSICPPGEWQRQP